MSRIKDALARARVQSTVPPGDSFINPWNFDEAGHATVSATLGTAPRPAKDVATPVLAVDRAPSAQWSPPDSEYAEQLLGFADLPRNIVEQYRHLGTAIHQSRREHGVRAVMVTSALAGEGKTLVASNLALVLSGSFHMRVLLVDADLRRPSIHSVFGLDNTSGLTDRLTAEVRVTPVVITPTLSVLPAGTPLDDPLRILASHSLQTMLEESVAQYDWVIVDTPPVTLLPDTPMLLASIDRVLMVIHAGRTPYDAIDKAIEFVGRERIVGTVLNQTARAMVPAASYYGPYLQAQR